MPPRMGGIVNGIVTECTVAEEAGISIGDYVQLVEGSGVLDSQDAIIYATQSTWTFGPFLLSDGSIATIYYYNGLKVRQSKVGTAGFMNEGAVIALDLTPLGSPVPNNRSYDEILVTELQQNKFIALVQDNGKGGFAFIEYNDGVWSLTALGVSGFSTTKVTYGAMCKIDSTRIAVAFNAGVYIGKLSGNTLTFGTSAALSSTNTVSFLKYIGGYLLLVHSGFMETFSVTGTTPTLAKTLATSSALSPDAGNTGRLTDNKLLMIHYGTATSSSKYNNDEYLYASIVTINSDGSISTTTNNTAIHYGTDFGTTTAFLVGDGMFYLFDDNRILVIAIEQLHYSSTYNGRVCACMGVYDEDSDTVSFDELIIQSDTPIASSSTSTSGTIYLPPVQLENGLLYGVVGIGTTMRQCLFKVEQDSIVSLSDSIFVKKYLNKISGVAKTAGANGSVIEVYAPSSLL